jgi:hypothetical protein
VVDPDGASVPNVALRLQAVHGQSVNGGQAVSDAEGHFRLLHIAPGDYDLQVPATYGFEQYQVPLHVGSAPAMSVQVRLTLASVSQEVSVAPPASQVDLDPSNPALGIVRQIESRGRQVGNALDLTLQGDTSGILQDHWLNLGIAAKLYSGMPYTETSGNDTYNTGMLNARPVGVNRNSLQTRGNAELDLRWSRELALQHRKTDKGPAFSMAVDAFNITNRTNYMAYVGNVQSSFYEQPTAALPARRLQFTARIKF